jgi:hypothetical protein
MTPAEKSLRYTLPYDGSFEQREAQKLAWIESLFEIFEAYSSTIIHDK